eukprot:Selendium_serpulae@DN1029_c0_g1_i1.p1
MLSAINRTTLFRRGTRLIPPGARGSGYGGMRVQDWQLVKKSDDWVVEETNFCLGRRPAQFRFQETDDMARRVLKVIEAQPCYMHTRLRDGTCIPFMHIHAADVEERPKPIFGCNEDILVKFTWDESYDEAYE